NTPPTGAVAIMALPITGGVPRTLVEPNHEIFPWVIRADKQSLYWVQTRGGKFSLWRAPITGGARELLGTAPTQAMNRDNRDHIELDETHVYWNARESVARVRKSGGPVEESSASPAATSCPSPSTTNTSISPSSFSSEQIDYTSHRALRATNRACE